MHFNKKRGFTLIELLVVIAIIGVLSAVVLASLNTARSKGGDAAVQSDITGVRTQAAIYLSNNNNYGPVLTEVKSDCADADNLFSDPTVKNQITAADAANGPTNGVVCNVAANGMSYAVSAALVATPSTFFCVDSTGTATTTSAALTATATSC